MTEIFGYSTEEFSALGHEEMGNLVYPSNRELVRQRAISRLEGQLVQPRYESPGGAQGRRRALAGGLLGPHRAPETPCPSQIAYIDITECKLAEEALLASEEKCSVAFRHSPVMAGITTLEEDTFLEVNDKFLEVSGFSRQEALGRTSVELGWISTEDRQRMVQTLLSQGRVSGMEVTVYNRHGQPLECLYNCELITIGGQQRLLGLALDIASASGPRQP